MSNTVKEQKKKETYTLGSYNCTLLLDGKIFEVLTIEAKDTGRAFQKIVRMYPLLRSKYLDDTLGWEDANSLVESLVDEAYEVEYDQEEDPMMLGKHQIDVPIKGEEDSYKTITGLFFKRIII